MNSSSTIVDINNVSFSYNGHPVLDDISIEIKKGEFLGLIGPNGSGKTTLLKIILGLYKPKSGSVSLFGKKTAVFKDWSKVGYVPQKAGGDNMRFPITVEEIVAMGRVNNNRWFDFTTTEDKNAIDQALNEVDMLIYKKTRLNELSGGQQQRVFIARALASAPELLILDEPTVGVDSESQAKFYELLKNLNKKLKLTLILVSHDIDVVSHEVGKLACINCKLVCYGKPKDLLKDDLIKKLYAKELRFVFHGH